MSNNCCKKLENQRKQAWRSYYQVQRILFETIQENQKIVNQLRQLCDEQKMQIPPHFKDELVKNLKELECPICFETMTFETFALTKCYHKLCKSCLEKLRSSGRCPVCRTNL